MQKRFKVASRLKGGLLLALTPWLLNACVSSAPNVAYPVASPSPQGFGGQDGSLASLLTGSVVSSEEAQLRDTLKRQILLDFPIRVGVLFYDFESRLDAPDREALFDSLSTALEDSEQVRETIQIPTALIAQNTNLEQLRQIGARFQTDILVIVNASHDFALSNDQNLSFWDSFSEKAYYESKVKYEAIALDIFTGTLLSPFDAAISGERILIDALEPNAAQARYSYQKSVEEQAWKMLQEEALKRLGHLEQEVSRRQSEIEPDPNPEPSPSGDTAAEDNAAGGDAA